MSKLWSYPARSSSLCRSIRWIATTNAQTTSRFFGSSAAAAKSSESSDDETEGRSHPSERVQRLAQDISSLSLLEVTDLTALLRKKLGLPSGMGMGMETIPPGMAMGSAGAASIVAEEAKVERTSFDVKLEKFDAGSKIKIIKEVRTFTDLGLKEAKELVEKAPIVLKSGVGKDEAEQIIEKLKSVGAIALME